MYISGGENVYPAEVKMFFLLEDGRCNFQKLLRQQLLVYQTIDGVRQAMAFISLKSEQTLEEKDIIEHCLKNLAKFKVPNSGEIYRCEIAFNYLLGRNATGKVLKRNLRDDLLGTDAPSIS